MVQGNSCAVTDCMKILKASFVEEYNALLGQGDELRRYMVTPDFWKIRTTGGATVFWRARAADLWAARAAAVKRA